ncbi:signal recognition particle receptor FtsY [Devosia pacifica]|uniref:Signal recognition particle receptor FtsY n=1 Tax=Devosia pacifica TaxID=1335967 RepID=A0A918S6L3_9HYPH|nr:signal recognition particle-docking protein FtsY [Devosia pacifica]GHA23647.1 signal recognition particle receptor FtsY [Devosia pacifica]
MSEKKPGFFKRLFGGQVETPPPQPVKPDLGPIAPNHPISPEPPEPLTEDPIIEPSQVASVDEPSEHELPPEDDREPPSDSETPDDDFPPGPPETDPDYVDDLEDTPGPQPAPSAPAPAVEQPVEETKPRGSWFSRLASGLKRSSDQLGGSIAGIFTRRKLDDETLEDLEDVLIQADLGIDTATAITESLRRDRYERDVSAEDVRGVLAQEVEKVLKPVAQPLQIDTGQKPFIILMVGVNGTGKTTTIGKLTQKLTAEGRSVMMAAGDTFRAAAIEQLQVWGERTGTPVISKPAGSDASGLAYEAVERATAEKRDVLIIDTAGRLQNRDELMGELEKIIRVIKKLSPDAPHAVLLTLDATTGQNALSQVEIFGKRAGVTGLVMTKLDGTARGGILVAIANRFGLPVHFIGVGEGVDDLEPFSASDFARAIAGDTQA